MSKKYILALIFSAISGVVRAENEALPPGASLYELPSSAKIFIVQPITLGLKDGEKYKKNFFGDNFTLISTKAESATREIMAGESLGVMDVRRIEGSSLVWIHTENHYIMLSNHSEYGQAGSVEKFNRKFSGILKLVWNDPDIDPFPNMPEDVKLDLLMTRILTAYKAGHHSKALPDFARVEKMGKPTPESFQYYYIVSLEKAGQLAKAKKKGTDFILNYGKSSKYYDEVLSIVAK